MKQETLIIYYIEKGLPVRVNMPKEAVEAIYNDDTPRDSIRPWVHAGNDPALTGGVWQFSPHPYVSSCHFFE